MEYTGKVYSKNKKNVIVRLNEEDSLNCFVKVKNTLGVDIADEVKIRKTDLKKSRWIVLFYFIPLITTISMFFVGMVFKNEIYRYIFMFCGFLIGFLILILIDLFYIKKTFAFNLIQ